MILPHWIKKPPGRIIFLGRESDLAQMRDEVSVLRTAHFARHSYESRPRGPRPDIWMDPGSKPVLCYRTSRFFSPLVDRIVQFVWGHVDWTHKVTRFEISFEVTLDIPATAERLLPVIFVNTDPQLDDVQKLEKNLSLVLSVPRRRLHRVVMAIAEGVSQIAPPISPIDALDAWELAQAGLNFNSPSERWAPGEGTWRAVIEHVDTRWHKRISEFAAGLKARDVPFQKFPVDLGATQRLSPPLNIVPLLCWLIAEDSFG